MDEGIRHGIFFLVGALIGGGLIGPWLEIKIDNWLFDRKWKKFNEEWAKQLEEDRKFNSKNRRCL